MLVKNGHSWMGIVRWEEEGWRDLRMKPRDTAPSREARYTWVMESSRIPAISAIRREPAIPKITSYMGKAAQKNKHYRALVSFCIMEKEFPSVSRHFAYHPIQTMGILEVVT